MANDNGFFCGLRNCRRQSFCNGFSVDRRYNPNVLIKKTTNSDFRNSPFFLYSIFPFAQFIISCEKMLSHMLKSITYKNTFCQYYNKYKICYIYVVILWTKSWLLKKGSSGEMTDTRFFPFESRKRPQKSSTPYRRKPTVHAMSLSISCWIGR